MKEVPFDEVCHHLETVMGKDEFSTFVNRQFPSTASVADALRQYPFASTAEVIFLPYLLLITDAGAAECDGYGPDETEEGSEPNDDRPQLPLVLQTCLEEALPRFDLKQGGRHALRELTLGCLACAVRCLQQSHR